CRRSATSCRVSERNRSPLDLVGGQAFVDCLDRYQTATADSDATQFAAVQQLVEFGTPSFGRLGLVPSLSKLVVLRPSVPSRRDMLQLQKCEEGWAEVPRYLQGNQLTTL